MIFLLNCFFWFHVNLPGCSPNKRNKKQISALALHGFAASGVFLIPQDFDSARFVRKTVR